MRTRHILPGLRPEPLASYLAGLGLIRVLGEQADADARSAWASGGLIVTTSVDDIAAWLADRYIPAPVLSPWNGGSGFGAKDVMPITRVKQLREHPSPRLDLFRQAVGIADDVMRDAGARDKATLVREFRNRCPDEVLPWIDAAVVLTGGDPQFPPILGTGGNDGRLDFSTNFHQCLIEVIGSPRSLAIARDLLTGTQAEKLSGSPIGQFDPATAGLPGSSKFGSAEPLLNPWGYVLMVEGALLFASSAVRRNQFAARRAAIPFTVAGSPDGSGSGAAGESTRGEVWAPLWDQRYTLPEIRQLFAEARASWRGRPARRAADFYAATRALGTARGVNAFVRYGLQQRNGLSFAAVPLDRIMVREDDRVLLAREVEDWVDRIHGADNSASVSLAARLFRKAHLEYVRAPAPDRLAAMLAALTSLTQAVGRSGRAREGTLPPYAPRADRYLKVLAENDDSRELRVAAGLASCAVAGEGGSKDLSLRNLLLPIRKNGGWCDTPVIEGFGVRALEDVLADVLIWRSRTAPDEPGTASFRGIPTFRNGIRVPAADLHAFARDQLDKDKLGLLLRACLALDWFRVPHAWRPPELGIPEPTLGVLQPLAGGLRPGGGSRRANGRPAVGSEDEEPEYALNPNWALRLAAGRVSDVHGEAAARLRQAGWIAVPPPPEKAAGSGVRIAAALVPRCADSIKVLSTFASKIKDNEEQS
jgi:CRISPR-associated protein Csx17